ncbi:c-type cytochrome [Marinimicrobium alkaliphilum]|uniref:c-type cytochrome n=1 Tax=Marinimicrobium alkaliphilum TaxID=2202654 RepID=UPI000DBA7507|nr:c-type cytochrome [Marinimicrobium alkaliphilum]
MVLVVILVLLVLGTVIFHFASPWWFTPLASNWGSIDTTINITFWITGLVFVAVNLFMAYAIFKFKHKKGQKSHYEPENKKLEIWLTGITALGIAIMLAPGLFVWASFVKAPSDAQQVEVVGKQWHWMYRFPGEDGELGRTDPRFVSEHNPFGLDPQDPAGQDDILVFSNILHLPVGQPHKFWLRSQDVLHNFAVPHFRAKMDLVPGTVTRMWLEPTRTGTFDVVCMQLCGTAHHAMRGKVVVQEQEDFDQWLASHPTFADTQSRAYRGDQDIGRALYATCASCHGQQGEGNQGLNAPRVAGLDQWYLERQLAYYKDRVRGYNDGDTYGQQMAAMMAVLPDRQAIRNVSAYMAAMPETQVTPTITGNTARGERLYRNFCSDCHGSDGSGNYHTNAPRISGQQDWYLERQVTYFRDGIRGLHPQDSHGNQMVMLVQGLRDEQAIRDVVAYINTLD